MNHFRARAFSVALAVLLAASAALRGPAGAQTAPATSFWFAGTRLIFDAPVALSGDVAVSVRDSGLVRLLARVGATLSYQPQQRYIVITTADRRIVSFTIGDARYAVGGVVSSAPFAPFFDGSDVIVPLYAVARALYVEPVSAGTETVFEPQIGALDVRPDGRRTIVTLHGATVLKYAKLSDSPERLAVTFSGIGSALTASRRIGGGVEEVDVTAAGSVKNPSSTLTILAPKGSQHMIAATSSPYEFSVVFGPPGVALDLNAQSAPASVSRAVPVPPPASGSVRGQPQSAQPQAPQPLAEQPQTPQQQQQQQQQLAQPAAPQQAQAQPQTENAPQTSQTQQTQQTSQAQQTPQASAAVVTDAAVEPQPDGGVNVRLSVDGTATYDWHRLRDDRWYLDVADATLTQAARDERPNTAAVDSVRIRQIGSSDAPVVRVAFSLHGDMRVDVTPADGSLTIAVANVPEVNLARTGNGQIGGATVAQSSAESPAGPPVAPIAPLPETTPWKFGPNPLTGNRVIVIDPGHGGADAGTAHNGLVEKDLTLDISLRLRALLAQAGWNVRLTRTTDIDPVSPDLLSTFAGDGRPNSSDRAYLQTRCDVANNAGARLFISIHINYSDSPGVRGTTFYYTKPQDVPLAQALERGMIPLAGTQDDGVVKSNLYVTKHTTMPAVLIETGFISNPGDVRLMQDPAFLQNVAAGIAAGVKAYAGALPALSRTDQ